MSRLTPREIKDHALARLDSVLAALGVTGTRGGPLLSCKNPTRSDKHAGSFVVYLSGARKGNFKEFADSDVWGDIIDLTGYVRSNGGDFRSRAAKKDALQWLAQHCGLSDLLPGAPPPPPPRPAAADADGLAAADKAKKLRRAHDMWMAALPLAHPRSALALAYLLARGIVWEAIAWPEADLRFIEFQEYWLGRTRAPGGAFRPGPSLPALCCAFRYGDGQFAGVHLTFLRPDGRGKADVEKPKLIWPAYYGAALRLTRGVSSLSVEDAIAQRVSGPCGLTEGIEDGLSLAMAAPDLRVWAAGSLDNVRNMPGLPCIDSWLLHRQNDWHSPAAIAAFGLAVAALEASGRAVGEIAAFAGKDINDTLRSGA